MIRARQSQDPTSPDYPFANVLGDVKESEVVFVNGQSGWKTFQLENDRFREMGVTASNQMWKWEFLAEPNTWTSFQTTAHRTYVVLELPSCPWEPRSCDPKNIQAPWTEALEYACHWAAGITKNLDLAASMVTDRVFALGKTLVTYASSGTFTDDKFDLTRFIALLDGKASKSHTLNCDDCASVVSTFANLLGCNLWQSSMGSTMGFHTNPVLQVGHSQWTTTGYLHHSVAWKGDCLGNDELFDAFLKVDGDMQPNQPPQFPLQPARIRFGIGRDRTYHFRLVRSGECEPIPNSVIYKRTRRRFGEVFCGTERIEDKSALLPIKRIYSFDSWPRVEDSRFVIDKTGSSLTDLLLQRFVLDGWERHFSHTFEDERFASLLEITFKRSTPSSESVALNVYEPSDANDSNELLLELLARFQFNDFTRPLPPPIGDVAFVQAGGLSALVRIGRIVAMLRSVGRERVSVLEPTMILKQLLTAPDELPVPTGDVESK